MKRREEGYMGKRMMEMAVPGRRKKKAKEKVNGFGKRRHGKGLS